MNSKLVTLLLVLLAVVGCGRGTEATESNLLPLAPNKPTFAFFFTDG